MAETQKPIETAPVEKEEESMQQTIDRVIDDGKVTKEELGELLSKYEAEKAKVTAETKTALDGLIKESLDGMLKNGFDLDKKSLPLLSNNGYSYDPSVMAALDKGEKVTVTLDKKDPKKVVESSFGDVFTHLGKRNQSEISDKSLREVMKDKIQAGVNKLSWEDKKFVQDTINNSKTTPDSVDKEKLFHLSARAEETMVKILGTRDFTMKINFKDAADVKDFWNFIDGIMNKPAVETKPAETKPATQEKTEEKPAETPTKIRSLPDKTPLKVIGQNVNFRDEHNKSLGKIGENGNLTLDLSKEPTHYKEHTMIPVKFGDKTVYIAEKYLSKKEEVVAPTKWDEKGAAEKTQKTEKGEKTTADKASELAANTAKEVKKAASAVGEAVKSVLESKKEGAETPKEAPKSAPEAKK